MFSLGYFCGLLVGSRVYLAKIRFRNLNAATGILIGRFQAPHTRASNSMLLQRGHFPAASNGTGFVKCFMYWHSLHCQRIERCSSASWSCFNAKSARSRIVSKFERHFFYRLDISISKLVLMVLGGWIWIQLPCFHRLAGRGLKGRIQQWIRPFALLPLLSPFRCNRPVDGRDDFLRVYLAKIRFETSDYGSTV
jgi:hypothetical protein